MTSHGSAIHCLTVRQSLNSPPSTLNFFNDHLSRLISRSEGVTTSTSTHYHYDGWNRIAEYINATLIDTFTWGLDLSGTMQGAGGVGGLLATRWVNGGLLDYFPTYDGNGNVVQYLTTAGAVNTHYEYDPFGTLTRLAGNNSIRFQYRFSTKPRDFYTGLYYYGYRWYDTPNARWPSRDPIEERGGLNLHGMNTNDCLNSIDFLGLSETLIITRAFIQHHHYFENNWKNPSLFEYGLHIEEYKETVLPYTRVKARCNSGTISLLESTAVHSNYLGGSELDHGVTFKYNHISNFTHEEMMKMVYSKREIYSGRKYLDYEAGTNSSKLVNNTVHSLFYGAAIYDRPKSTRGKWVLSALKKVPVFGDAFSGLQAATDAINKLAGPLASDRSKGSFSSKFVVCCDGNDLVFKVNERKPNGEGNMKVIVSKTIR